METEYAAVAAALPQGSSLASSRMNHSPATVSEVYRRIAESFRHQCPSAQSVRDSQRWFLANGAALGLETQPFFRHLSGGLVEVATPEVRSPSDLLACQRAMDAMMAEAIAGIEGDEKVVIFKNSRDAVGHAYGAQENYECDVATGAGLGIYRIAIIGLWFVQLVCLLFSLPIMLLIVASTCYLAWRRGNLANAPEDHFQALPLWFSSSCITSLRLVHWPLVFGLRCVTRHLAFRRQRRFLTGLLVSRIAVCGAGHLDEDGCFYLSGKAAAIDRVSDMGGFSGEYPIFVFGHWLTLLFGQSLGSLWQTRGLLRRRQRLQIGLSDSNRSDLAEYVKFGSVSLVLDMIDAGLTKDLPTVKRPLAVLSIFNRDWNLIRRVPTSHGEMTSLELQRTFHRSASSFVQSRETSDRAEAILVLRRWGEAIDLVGQFRRDGHQTQQGIGRIDWLAKRWMMDQLGKRTTSAARKKIDLKYHELSATGYHDVAVRAMRASVGSRNDLDQESLTDSIEQSSAPWRDDQSRPTSQENPLSAIELVAAETVALRRRTPPSNSPAARRGWFIREFADGDATTRVDWAYGTVGLGKSQRRVWFDDAKH